MFVPSRMLFSIADVFGHVENCGVDNTSMCRDKSVYVYRQKCRDIVLCQLHNFLWYALVNRLHRVEGSPWIGVASWHHWLDPRDYRQGFGAGGAGLSWLPRRYPCVSSLSHRNGDNPCTRQAVGVLAHPWSSHYGIKHNGEYFDTIIAYIIMQPP